MRKKIRSVEGLTPLAWLRRALPEVAHSGLLERHTRVLRDPTFSRALRGSIRRLRAELRSQSPRDEAALRAADAIAAELGPRSRRGQRSQRDRDSIPEGSGLPTSRPAPGEVPRTDPEPEGNRFDAVLTAIAAVPLRTAWEWFRQGMQLANTLSSPERSRAANAAGKLLAQDVAAALAKLNDEKSVRWVPGAQVVAEFESRLGTLALRDLRESCDPLTPHDVGQAILEAISRHEHRGNQMDPRRESPQLVSSWGARQEQVFQPIGDEKCPRCGHDPESCFGAFADEDA